MRQEERRAAVQVHHARLHLRFHVDELAVRAEPCVVDEEADAQVARAHRLGQGDVHVGAGEIVRDRDRADFVGLRELARERLEAIEAARDEHEVHAARRESARERVADPRGRARDERRAAEALGEGHGAVEGARGRHEEARTIAHDVMDSTS